MKVGTIAAPCRYDAASRDALQSEAVAAKSHSIVQRRTVARPKRFELLTPRFVVWCSIQLSYGRVLRIARENVPGPSKAAGNAPLAIGFGRQWQVRRAQKDAPTRLHVRVPDAVQRVSGAPLIRDRHGPKRSRVCSASLRAAL